jgi:hypothetical protein
MLMNESAMTVCSGRPGLSRLRYEARLTFRRKRRDDLNRCRYKGDRGMKRWSGIGVSFHCRIAG